MKAVPFLEYFKKVLAVGLFQSYDMLDDAQDDLSKVHDFYSQPFKPEMIVECFEGWRMEVDVCYRHDKADVSIVVFPYHLWMRVGMNTPIETHNPSTLDQFISDCQRAGIELVWKADIVEKYFK